MSKPVLKGSPTLMQKLNTSLMVDVIQKHGPISRAELAKRTGLSNPAVSTLIASLLEEEIIREVGTADSTGGRPARLLEFNEQAGYLVGVDVGGTSMSGALVDLGGNILHREKLPTRKNQDTVSTLTELIEKLLEGSALPKQRFRGIGLGIPGVTDAQGQKIAYAPGVGWENLDLGKILGDKFGVPLFADNDVNCFARGEMWRGELQNVKNGAAVTIGTGIGVGLIIDEHLYQGANNAAGEVGYWLLGSLGPIEKPTGYGPLESIAAGPGIARQAMDELKSNEQSGPILRELVGNDLSGITAKEIFEAARSGDVYSAQLIEQSATYLGICLANMATLLNMEKIVIGGGVSKAGSQLLDPVRHIVATLSPYPPQIEISTLQEDGAILGAVSGVLGLRESSIHFSELDWENAR